MIETLRVRIGSNVILMPRGDYYLRYRDRFDVSNEFVIPAKSFRRMAPFRPKVFISAAKDEKPAHKPAMQVATASTGKTAKPDWNPTVSTLFEQRVTPGKLRGMLVKLNNRRPRR